MTNNNTNAKGLLYPNPCPHCGKENSKKACYEFYGEQNKRKYGVCIRGANSPGNGWEQALTRNKASRTDSAGNLVYQEIIPYNRNGHNGQSSTQYHKPEAEHYYHDRQGKPLVRVCKYRKPNGDKFYSQSHYTPEGKWEKRVNGYVNREDIAIYHYREIRSSIEAGKPIWIVEGEKCADKLFYNLGLSATTNIRGSKKWKPSDTECLAGAKEIILCPDRDRPGIEHMESIYKQLLDAGFSDSSIKWLYVYPDSPEEWANLPLKKGLDIFDWIKSGATYNLILESVQEEKKAIALPSPKIETSSIPIDNQDISILSSSVDKVEHQKITDKIQSLFYTEDGKRKAVGNGAGLKIIHIIYGDMLRYNLQTLEPWLGNELFKETEGDLEHLYIRASYLYGVEIPKEKLVDSVLTLAKQKKFHPVEDYLRRVTKEVKPVNIDNLATKYFGVTDELSNIYLKHWLLAATARAIHPGCYVRNVLILQGNQDIGKSTFFKILGGEHFCDSLGDCKDKDQKMIANRKWIHEWAEFEKLWRKSLRSEVKAFITATEDTYRVPYGRSTDTFARRFILCGTSNEEQFLQDPTGNNRFWIISINQKIDLEQLAKDRDAIWSATTQIVLDTNPNDVMTGKLWKLPEHLLEANRENTAKYEEVNEWEDTIHEVIESFGNCGLIHPDKIWEALDIDKENQIRHGSKVNEIMTKFGWKRSNKRKTENGKQYRPWIPKN